MSEEIARRDEVNTRKIVFQMRYSDINRVLEDAKRLRAAYNTMYPTKVDMDAQGLHSLLVMQGYIQVLYNVTRSHVMLMFKVFFPIEYPKAKPIISVQNPNQNAHECNSLYLMSGLGTYEQSAIDKRFHLIMLVPRLKEWSPKSDLLGIVNEIITRLNENFPFVRKQAMLHTSPSLAAQKDNMHPALKAEVDKAELDMAQMTSEFQLLILQKNEAIFNMAYHQVIGNELQRKFAQISKNIHQIAEVVDEASAIDLTISTVDRMITYEGNSAKILQLASERDALEECHQYLRNQLKEGVSMYELSKTFKNLFEEMFDNQYAINQLG